MSEPIEPIDPSTIAPSPTHELAGDACLKMYAAAKDLREAIEMLTAAKPKQRSKKKSVDNRPESFKTAEALLDAAQSLIYRAEAIVADAYGVSML